MVLVVWHKIDIREVGWGSLLGTLIALGGVTAATLYQKHFCADADLKGAALVQFSAALLVTAPLAVAVEGFRLDWAWQMAAAIVFLVIFTSILGVSALYVLIRHNEATRVTSMMYLPPVFAVALEMAMFGVVPSALAFAGMALTCAGVALAVWKSPRLAPTAVD